MTRPRTPLLQRLVLRLRPLRALLRRPSRRTAVALVLTAFLPVLAVATANAVVLAQAAGRSSDDVRSLPQAQVAIVPGALVHADGTLSPVLVDRVAGAAALYRAGRVQKVLVSGDHARLGYDETDAMRDAVVAAGVPPRDVFTDYAGFSTWSTMARARHVFEVHSAIVVTQGVFMARSLDLGQAAGIDVHGLDVDGTGGFGRTEADAREVLARVEGLGQATLRPRVMGGPVIPITGDGRTSWGPADPDAPTPQVTRSG